jgi:DNA mismatch repair protein MutL
MNIQPLPPEIADRISAGEVIERPADAVKELLENALDAGATSIVLELTDGFKQMEGKIVVSDNGSGISPDDMLQLFQRHSTSKIRSLDDLEKLSTLGFRGEALASMGAVAEVSVTSKTPDGGSGRRIACIGGRVGEIEECGCPDGTRVSISRLFFNTPARAKFLKSDLAEFRVASRAILRLAIFHLTVGFILRHHGGDLLSTPPYADDILSRAGDIWGVEIASQMQVVESENGLVRVKGIAALPSVFRSNSTYIYVAVNSRPIADRSLVFAISRLYKGILPVSHYPIVALNIIVPPDFIDVNVHPRKEEVRFQKTELVEKAISEALLPVIAGTVAGSAYFPLPIQQYTKFGAPITGLPETAQGAAQRAAQKLPSYAQGERLSPTAAEPTDRDWRIVGQLDKMYILVAYSRGLVIIDQHAAHERLVYNALLAQKGRNPFPCQQLLIPRPIHLSIEETRTVERYQMTLADMGYQVERFGGGVFILRSLPAGIPPENEDELLRDILEGLANLGESGRMEQAEQEILVRTSCHIAIRAGENISLPQMEALVEKVMTLPLSERRCPHGRPLVVEISAAELSKRFGRS